MYVLAKLEKRAETTDTILYYVAHDRKTLEELLLSLYDELIDIINKYGSTPNDKETIREFFNTFYIVEVPVIS